MPLDCDWNKTSFDTTLTHARTYACDNRDDDPVNDNSPKTLRSVLTDYFWSIDGVHAAL